jgi:2,4-dienoyl-CoA reductase-like NADH-dependent reductase (Old Yellow Enzyme family)
MSAEAKPLTALLSPLTLDDDLTLRNRVVMAPMTR